MGRRQAALIASLLVAIAAPAVADDIATSVPDQVVGDGRTAIPVSVNGTGAGAGKPLPIAEVSVVTCTGAATLAAIGSALPAILAPAVTAASTIDCTARLRDSKAAFKLRLRPPPRGLYASTNQIARSTDGQAALSAFVWDGKRRSVPSWLHAAASDGTVAISKGGILTLGLAGKAPRTIALAMIDGVRVGAAFVPVTGSTLLPVEAEAGSSVQVWVAGTWYGPVPTHGKVAEVPIDVPAGVTRGVARSTDKKGYVSDVIVDLKIPARPRIAIASAAPSVGAGETMMLAVAIAGPDARPLAGSATLVAAAERGSVTTPVSLGGGLWTVRYTAPAAQSRDKITVRVQGDDRAGTGEITLAVRGTAAKIELSVPAVVEPGGELTGTVRVLDAAGIVLREPDISVTLAGEPVEVVAGDVLTLHGKVPETAPANPVLALEVVSGSVRIKADLVIGGGPARATIHASATDRSVRAAGTIGLGAWLAGGYHDNLGSWATPRAGAGGAIERRFGSIEAALLVGVEGVSSRSTFILDVNGVMHDATRTIAGIAIPVALRGRHRLGERFGVSGTLALMPWRMSVKFTPDEQTGGRYTEWMLGFRGQVAGDVTIGPGRVLLGISFGRAKLSDGAVVGQVDGLGATLCYEWWFSAISP